MNHWLKELKRIVKYIIRQKVYYKNIQVCGMHAEYTARLVADRLGLDCQKGRVACFNTYSTRTVLHYHRAPIKLFFTQENTHAPESRWQWFKNVWQNEPSLSLTLGFDYTKHPKYLRFPYWLSYIFIPEITKEQIISFVEEYNISKDNVRRTKDCAFVCKKDYYGDRAQMADLVAQVMQMSYPSDFRHNDDDMRGKFNDDKIAYLRQFKFNLCPENSNNKGYVTEKIFEAIKAGCVPIYWGNEGYPEPDILNPKAIVYLDKDKPEEGLALLSQLYVDPKAYEEFAGQPRFLPGAAEKIYAYYERLEDKLRDVLKADFIE